MVVARKEKARGRTLSFSLKDEYWGLGPYIPAEAKRVGATGSSVRIASRFVISFWLHAGFSYGD